MGRIAINLSPQKGKVSSALLQKFSSYTPLVLLSSGAVLIIIIFLQLVILQRVHTQSVYSKKWAGWESKATLLREIRVETAALENEKLALDQIITPKYEMAFILRDIFSSLIKNMWFETVRFEEDSISLRGYVVKWKEDYLLSLDKFVNSLQKEEYFSSKFSKVNIKESQKENFNGAEVLQFVIECRS